MHHIFTYFKGKSTSDKLNISILGLKMVCNKLIFFFCSQNIKLKKLIDDMRQFSQFSLISEVVD